MKEGERKANMEKKMFVRFSRCANRAFRLSEKARRLVEKGKCVGCKGNADPTKFIGVRSSQPLFGLRPEFMSSAFRIAIPVQYRMVFFATYMS